MHLNKVWWFIEGYRESEEAKERAALKRMRIIAYSNAAYATHAKNFPKSPEKWMPFYWEKEMAKDHQQTETAQEKYDRLKKTQQDKLKKLNIKWQ